MPHREQHDIQQPPASQPHCEIAARGECPFEERMRQMASDVKAIKEECEFQSRLMTGHTDPSKGFIVRLDRLERTVKLLWAALVAGVLALCTLAWNTLTTKR